MFNKIPTINLNFLTPPEPTPEVNPQTRNLPSVKTKLLILGSGPAGLTAAIYAGRAGLSPLVLGGCDHGQLDITETVENYPGFPAGILGPQLTSLFTQQAEKFGAQIVMQTAEAFEVLRPKLVSLGSPLRDPYRFIITTAQTRYHAQAVIVATGASALWLGLASEERLRGHGVSACATCDGYFFKGQTVAVIGGGDTAAEEALFLANLAAKVFLVVRRNELRASKILQDRLLNSPKIEILFERTVQEILGTGKVSGLSLVKTGGEVETLAVEGVFVAIGYHPNSELFSEALFTTEHGYLLTEGTSTASLVEGVFIAGDVRDFRYRQAVTAAADGARAAIDAEHWLSLQD
jgi:thioredoxin reductase (NADPH)